MRIPPFSRSHSQARRPRGRPRTWAVTLTTDERRQCRLWRMNSLLAHGRACRARLLLLLDDGATLDASAQAVGMSRKQALKWIRRYLAGGLHELKDRKRGVRRRGYLAEDEDALKDTGN